MIKDSLEKLRLEKKHALMKKRCANTRRKKRSMERRKNVIRQNFISGKIGEEKILKILQKKYENIVDNISKINYGSINVKPIRN